MKMLSCRLGGIFLLLLALQFPCRLTAQSAEPDWNVAVLDQIIASVPPGQNLAQVGDMRLSVSYLRSWRNQLSGQPSQDSAFSGSVPTWTGGNIYYEFATTNYTVTAAHQRAFIDAANEWAMFANLHFIPHTTQSNYVTVQELGGLEGGQADVGMVGGQQFLSVSPDAWNRGTICHEIGHLLGLVHEHQRSDRNSFVTILTNNLDTNSLGNFVILANSQNQGAYDFYSVMHYARDYLSTNGLDTIEPLPAYAQFLNIMGQPQPIILSAGDRAGMATIYGAIPPITSVVTNTADSGPGTLRAAMYYAFDHPGTTITFNIPTNDPGYSGGVFSIKPSDQLPWLVNATVLDGSTQPGNSNPNGPAIQLNGAFTPSPGPPYPSGLRLCGTNCTVHSLVINGFTDFGIVIDTTNSTGNTVSGCYIGIDPSGTFAVPNGILPVVITNGAHGNTVGGTTTTARNVISGSAVQGITIHDPGTVSNTIAGNYIGLNASGTASLPNAWAGVEIYNGAQSNIIGGTTSGARNVISGNGKQGILIHDPGTTGNVVAGNYFGPSAVGTNAIPNVWAGVNFAGGAQSNLLGGAIPGAGNVISGNGLQGVLLQDSGTSFNLVQGNLIGLNPAGAAAMSNTWSGVEISGGAQANTVGGGPGARNFISGNGNYGVYIQGSGVTLNVVQGNTIGLNAAGTVGVSNTWAGIALANGATSNVIGGVTFDAANIIADNGLDAVQLFSTPTTNNSVRGNSIFGNNGYGIALYGGNNLAPAPSLASAIVTTNTTVIGSLSSLSNTTFHLDFYANPPSQYQAMTYLGSKDVTTGTGGSVNFTNSFASPVQAGHIITVAATDPAGNTSSLSSGTTVTAADSVGDGIPNAWRAAHFGGSGTTTNSSSCAACDPDHDGLTNLQEFLAGTDPNNAASALHIGLPAKNGADVIVSFPSVSGIIYRVEVRSDITGGNWIVLADQIVGTGGVIQVADPGAALLPKSFYRVDVLP
jgi:hypothetical protein